MVLYRVLCGQAEWLLGSLRSVWRCLLRLLYLHGSRGHRIKEIPYEDRVVVRAADDLEIVKLQPKHPPRVLLKRNTAEKGEIEKQ